MTHKITEIKGLEPAMATKLQHEHIDTVDDLLKAVHTPAQRTALAKQLGVQPAMLTEWINRADLMRLKGVGTEMANLLEDCGVDSVKELQHRKPDTLAAKLKEVNDTKHITHHAPTHTQVQEWIDEARMLATQSPV